MGGGRGGVDGDHGRRGEVERASMNVGWSSWLSAEPWSISDDVKESGCRRGSGRGSGWGEKERKKEHMVRGGTRRRRGIRGSDEGGVCVWWMDVEAEPGGLGEGLDALLGRRGGEEGGGKGRREERRRG